jgi:hypothetical protein
LLTTVTAGNTRLPHPEANLSPDATITADDVPISKLQARSRRSFLSKTNRRTISHGIITPEMQRMHTEAATIPEIEVGTMPTTIAGRVSKDGGESLDRTDSSWTADDDAPAAPRVVSSGSPTGNASGRQSLDAPKVETEKRRSLLRKIRMP